MGEILGPDGLAIKQLKSARWVPFKDHLYEKLWMEVLETEWWETGGAGYNKCSWIKTPNRKKKENFEEYFKEKLEEAIKEQLNGK